MNQISIFGIDSLQKAKDDLRDNWEQGTSCPCCGQFVKIYRRKLTSSMARGLISLYRSPAQQLHIKSIASVNGGEFAQLKRWGLVDDSPSEDGFKRRSGWWDITDKGRKFAMGLTSVPRYCNTYDGKTLGFSEEKTDIKTALGDKFSYTELMS